MATNQKAQHKEMCLYAPIFLHLRRGACKNNKPDSAGDPQERQQVAQAHEERDAARELLASMNDEVQEVLAALQQGDEHIKVVLTLLRRDTKETVTAIATTEFALRRVFLVVIYYSRE